MDIHTQKLRICVFICIASTNVCMHMRAYSVSKQDTTHFGSLQLLLVIHCVRSITLTLAYALTLTHTHIFKGQILQSMAYCHCPVYVDFPFYLFSCFNCAHALHTYNCSSRASRLAPFHCVDIFIWAFFVFLTATITFLLPPHHFTSPSLQLFMFPEPEGNIMLFRIIQLF